MTAPYTSIAHPDFLKVGVRLIMRVWRNKDSVEGRRPGRTVISAGIDDWHAATERLLSECIPGERVYASGEARDVDKAIRVFKERQLAADYDSQAVKHSFYNNCETRWLSCLGAPQASAETYFLFDCDDTPTHIDLLADFDAAGLIPMHQYGTKNGHHVLTLPFNPGLLQMKHRDILQKNPLVLIGWA